jgi:hypothetical protein
MPEYHSSHCVNNSLLTFRTKFVVSTEVVVEILCQTPRIASVDLDLFNSEIMLLGEGGFFLQTD